MALIFCVAGFLLSSLKSYVWLWACVWNVAAWNYVFEDSYGRGTILKINLAHQLFQFITPDKDYGIRETTYMHQCGRAIVIRHFDGELRLVTVAVDTRLDLCIAVAWDVQMRRQYLLLDRVGIESDVRFFKYSIPFF